MSEGHINLSVQGHVAQVTIDDLARHNAMSLSMWTALLAAFEEIDRRTEVRVCVLRGAGDKSFVSGANISEFETQRNSEASVAHYNDMAKGDFLLPRASDRGHQRHLLWRWPGPGLELRHALCRTPFAFSHARSPHGPGL